MRRTRAQRRHNNERFRNKTRKIIKSWDERLQPEDLEKSVRAFEQHRKMCSCSMCRKEKYRQSRVQDSQNIIEVEKEYSSNEK